MDERNIPQPPEMNPQGQPTEQTHYQQPGYQQVPRYGIPLVKPQMSFVDAIKTVLIQKYCCFTGRARRSEFWNWALAHLIVSVIFSFLATFLTLGFYESIDEPMNPLKSPSNITSAILGLALFLPNLGVTVRRLHDTGRSGWWAVAPLLLYVPLAWVVVVMGNGDSNMFLGILAVMGVVALLAIAYSIVMIVWLVQDSDPKPNQYGPSPKYN
ncbi:MAG: DUF805 domain-containing protein [Muribaculaceae bacterium]|nr:DUF805 domain-containing protein [Muribaculaceae bacterium]